MVASLEMSSLSSTAIRSKPDGPATLSLRAIRFSWIASRSSSVGSCVTTSVIPIAGSFEASFVYQKHEAFVSSQDQRPVTGGLLREVPMANGATGSGRLRNVRMCPPSSQRALTPQQVRAIRFRRECEQPLREHAIFDLAGKLRGGESAKLKIGDLVRGCPCP